MSCCGSTRRTARRVVRDRLSVSPCGPIAGRHLAAGRGMSLPLEDYAVIGDTRTVALVGKNGSIDWLCLPRFDSGACFAALLGEPRHGRWSLAPHGGGLPRVRRRYRDNTLVLETETATSTGRVRVL